MECTTPNNAEPAAPQAPRKRTYEEACRECSTMSLEAFEQLCIQTLYEIDLELITD